MDLIKAEVEVKDEDGENQPRGEKRSRGDGEASNGRVYKATRNSEGIEVIDLSDD
jgi:hypothetical protein